MPIIYSKKEYLGLTENGYKEATRVDANAHNARSAEDAGKTIIRGDQYINYAHAGAMGHRAKERLTISNNGVRLKMEPISTH